MDDRSCRARPRRVQLNWESDERIHQNPGEARLAPGDLRQMLGHDEPIFLSVSPAGGRACTIGANEGKLWETNGWSLLASWDQRELGKSTPQFSPRGTYVATITPAGSVSIRQASDGSPVLDLDPPVDISAALLVWLGETKLLLISTIDGLWEWDLTKLGQAAESEGISWSRHGNSEIIGTVQATGGVSVRLANWDWAMKEPF